MESSSDSVDKFAGDIRAMTKKMEDSYFGKNDVHVWCIGQLEPDYGAIRTVIYGIFTSNPRPPLSGWIFIGRNYENPVPEAHFKISQKGTVNSLFFVLFLSIYHKCRSCLSRYNSFT